MKSPLKLLICYENLVESSPHPQRNPSFYATEGMSLCDQGTLKPSWTSYATHPNSLLKGYVTMTMRTRVKQIHFRELRNEDIINQI